VESSTIPFLVHRSPTKKFKLIKGLRKRDPPTPFLFLIIVEALTRVVRQATRKNILEGVLVGKNDIMINML